MHNLYIFDLLILKDEENIFIIITMQLPYVTDM